MNLIRATEIYYTEASDENKIDYYNIILIEKKFE